MSERFSVLTVDSFTVGTTALSGAAASDIPAILLADVVLACWVAAPAGIFLTGNAARLGWVTANSDAIIKMPIKNLFFIKLLVLIAVNQINAGDFHGKLQNFS